jgi:hypothetical protein
MMTAVQVRAETASSPHFDLEMSSAEYQRALGSLHFFQTSGPLQNILDSGKRNMQWLEYINSFRDDAHKIHLTRVGEETGIPIDAPKKYSEQTVLTDFAKWRQEAPAQMVSVLTQAANLTQNPSVSEAMYVEWARKLDHIYQTDARWILMQPAMSYLQDRKAADVRGTYFLERVPDLQSELANWAKLAPDRQVQFRDWLLSICYNSEGLSDSCAEDLKDAEQAGTLFTYFQNYQQAGKDRWNSFFQIPKNRQDVRWTAQDSAEMKVPFLIPSSATILSFLRDNIEDEWKTALWNLRLDFQSAADPSSIPHMEFSPGVTPHVNKLAGNIITMDQNAPLDEWDVRWTIRHEFGHVLGFLDCYVEYYEPSEKVIVSYQLDVTNLMCSRQGRLQTQHFAALKKAYYK